jgi:AcrR family transcriptional regulator
MDETVRRTGRTERTRAALIAAGRRLFCERPVESVAIDDIVQAADVAKGSFYNHFADREALARAIAEEIRSGVELAVGRANADVADPARRVARAVCVYLRFAVDDPERAGVAVRMLGGLGSVVSPLNQRLVDDMAQGLATGRFAVATIETGVLYVFGVAQMTLARAVQEPTPSLAVSLAQQMCALLLRGLGVASPEAETIAAQAADEIVRRGVFSQTATAESH